MNYNKFVSTAHADRWIVCCVSNDLGITETVPSMCTCPISGRPDRWHFWLYIKHHQIKTQNNDLILCISSILYLFIGIYSISKQYSLVFIKFQCKLLIHATVQFKWPCIERKNFWHKLIYIYIYIESTYFGGAKNGFAQKMWFCGLK